MGKGGRKKLREAEEVKSADEETTEMGERDAGEDEAEGERRKEEKMWRPRAFKWKFVRRQ